jgi:hypothetical protein
MALTTKEIRAALTAKIPPSGDIGRIVKGKRQF